jgi:hypothetical protein
MSEQFFLSCAEKLRIKLQNKHRCNYVNHILKKIDSNTTSGISNAVICDLECMRLQAISMNIR